MDTKKEIQTTVRLPEELHQKLTDRVAKLRHTDERTTINEEFRRAIEARLAVSPLQSKVTSPTSGVSKPPEKGNGQPIALSHTEAASESPLLRTFASPDNRRLLEMLAVVLNSGVSDAIGAVTQNLEVFAKYVEGQEPDAAPSKRRKKRAGG